MLEEESVNIPSWICFTTVDGENAPSGESFKDCLEAINKSIKVDAVGINCAPPHFIESLICKFKQVIVKSDKMNLSGSLSKFMILSYCFQLTKKAIIVYPNSGEVWDGKAKKWQVSLGSLPLFLSTLHSSIIFYASYLSQVCFPICFVSNPRFLTMMISGSMRQGGVIWELK